LPTVRKEECCPTNGNNVALLYENVSSETEYLPIWIPGLNLNIFQSILKNSDGQGMEYK
jgi:hypothetical protein